MEFEYSLVKWFSRQFSVGFMYSIHFDVLYNYLDQNFSICIALLQTIINVYCAHLYPHVLIFVNIIYFYFKEIP